MYGLNEEQSKRYIEALEKKLEKENQFLDSRGWIQCLGQFEQDDGQSYIDEAWAHPITLEKYHMYTDAFDMATNDYLKEKGWKDVLEIERWGDKKWEKDLEKMGRYQSPKTKRIYNFLEAQWLAIDRDFNESDYPYGMSQHTIEINELFKNYDKDEYFIWFHRNGKDECVSELWTQDEIKAYKTEEASKISRILIETGVSVEEARICLNWAHDNVDEALKRAMGKRPCCK